MTVRLTALSRALTVVSLLTAVGAHGGALETVPDIRPAPPLPASSVNAPDHRQPDFAGNVLLINFWAGWCPPCLREMPALQRLAERFEGRPFQVLAVNVGEDARRVRETLRRLDYRGIVLLDKNSMAFDAWDVEVLPTSFVVDGRGRIRLRVVGELDWDAKDFDRVIHEMIGSLGATPD